MLGVIHYAYGAPTSIDEVNSYFSHILNGKTVPAPMMDNIVALFKKMASQTSLHLLHNVSPAD